MPEIDPAYVTAAVSIILAVGVVAVPCLGLWQRVRANKGIGWQFIRFTVLAIAVPVVGILALNGVIAGEATAALIGAAVGYAFAKTSDKSE